jgi:hypothetical protein
MAEYTPGQNADEVIKVTEGNQILDLTVFITKFVRLRNALQNLPKAKTVPDQETLVHWMATEYQMGQDDKVVMDMEVKELYNELTAIKNAGLLPSKYDDNYQQLENYVNKL